WKLIFKATSGAPFGVYDLYTSSRTLNEYNTTAMQLDNQLLQHYKSDFLNTWKNNNVTRVKVSVYKDSMEKMYMIFDGTGSDNEDWFTGSKLLNSSFQDIDEMRSNAKHFSVRGDDTSGVVRRFFINRRYAGCAGDNGWLVVTDANKPTKCDVDKVTVATVFYSTKNAYDMYNNCDCSCNTNTTYITLNDTEALQQKLEELRQILKVYRNATSKYTRTKISAPDHRPSATGMGVVLGMGILTFSAFIVVIPDLPVLYRHFYVFNLFKEKKR
ncbi:hypothetical protein FSP39_009614, partial [Pinctada imbricata]